MPNDDEISNSDSFTENNDVSSNPHGKADAFNEEFSKFLQNNYSNIMQRVYVRLFKIFPPDASQNLSPEQSEQFFILLNQSIEQFDYKTISATGILDSLCKLLVINEDKKTSLYSKLQEYIIEYRPIMEKSTREREWEKTRLTLQSTLLENLSTGNIAEVLDIAQQIVHHGDHQNSELSSVNPDTLLAHAVRTQNMELIDGLLNLDLDLIEISSDLPMRTPLEIAIASGNDVIINKLLAHKYLDYISNGSNYLSCAIEQERFDIVKVLYDKGARISAKKLNDIIENFYFHNLTVPAYFNRYLQVAQEWHLEDIESHNLEILAEKFEEFVDIFVKSGVPLELITNIAEPMRNTELPRQEPVLEKAIRAKNMEVIDARLKLNIDVHDAFMTAIKIGDDAIINKIVAHKNFDCVVHGEEYLRCAIEQEKFDTVKLLYDKGARISPEVMSNLISSISWESRTIPAYFNRYMEVATEWSPADNYLIKNALKVEYFRDQFIDIFVRSGISAKFIAQTALAVNPELLKKISALQDVKLSEKDIIDAFRNAVDDQDLENVKAFISFGVNVNHNDSEFLLATISNDEPNIDILNMLLDMGANPKSNGYQLPLIALEEADYWENEHDYLQEEEQMDTGQFFDMTESLLLKMGHPQSEIESLFERFDNQEINIKTLIQETKALIEQSLSPAQNKAFQIIYYHRLLAEGSNESSMAGSLLSRANKKFLEIKPKLKQDFKQYGATKLEAVIAIEREIKTFILDNIIANANQQQNQTNTEILGFIEKNKAALLEGNQSALADFRALCKDNEDTAQVAWRAYDPFAPHDPTWPNLLTERLDLRERVAYYFIAKPPINKDNFLAQLADIRRAHVHPTLDSPSCEPGIRGRIAKMGEGHPLLQIPPDRNEVIRNKMNAVINQEFSQTIKDMPPAQQLECYHALTDLCSATALDILNEQIPYSDQQAKFRHSFCGKVLKKLGDGTVDELNSEFAQLNDLPLKNFELDVVINAEVENIGGNGRAMTLYERVSPDAKPKPVSESKHTTPTTIKNPFEIALPSSLMMRKARIPQLEKLIQQNIEFELLHPILCTHFKDKNPAHVQKVAKILSEEMILFANELPQDRLQKVMQKLNDPTFKIEMSKEALTTIESILQEHSSLLIDERKFEHISNYIEELKVNTKDVDVKAKLEVVRKKMEQRYTGEKGEKIKSSPRK